MVTIQRYEIDAQGKHRPMKGKILIMPRRKVAARAGRVKRHKVLRFVPGRSIVPARAVTIAAQSFCSRKKP